MAFEMVTMNGIGTLKFLSFVTMVMTSMCIGTTAQISCIVCDKSQA